MWMQSYIRLKNDIITEKKGVEGRMAFAKKTGVPRSKALKAKETDEVMRQFKALASELLGEEIEPLL